MINGPASVFHKSSEVAARDGLPRIDASNALQYPPPSLALASQPCTDGDGECIQFAGRRVKGRITSGARDSSSTDVLFARLHANLRVLDMRDVEDRDEDDERGDDMLITDLDKHPELLHLQARGRKLYETKDLALIHGDWDNLFVRAARRGRLNALEWLQEKGCSNENHKSGAGESALFAACMAGQLKAVELLVWSGNACLLHNLSMDPAMPSYDPQVQGEWEATGKYYYTGNGFDTGPNDLDVIDALVHDHPDHIGDLSRLYERKLAILKHLLEEEPKDLIVCELAPEDREYWKSYKLLMAVESKHLFYTPKKEMVSLLLRHGFNPNGLVRDMRYSDDSQCSVLHAACQWAVEQTDYTAVKLLMQSGVADPHQQSRRERGSAPGDSPIDFAWSQQDAKLLDLLQPSTEDPAPAPAALLAGSPSKANREESPGAGSKRARRMTPVAERAAKAGVSHRLKELPAEPAPGAAEEVVQAYKCTLHAVQRSNQQVVSRAEQQQVKQRQQQLNQKMAKKQVAAPR